MNELSNHIQIEQQVKKQQEKEFKLESSLVPMKGHSVWEINTQNLTVKKAQFKKREVISWTERIDCTKEIVKKKGCVYISALNQKTALERYKKGKGSSTIPEGRFKL